MQDIADPAIHDPLWERARAMFARATAAIGEPQAMAARGALTRQTKHDIAGWLARLESIVRKLLLALAASLLNEARGERGPRGLRPRTAPRLQTHAQQARPEVARSKPPLDLTRPETWSARFALASPRDPHAVPESRAPRIRALWGDTPPAAPPPTEPRVRNITEPALRFAFRLEALKRVLADPVPHARRLARIFARLLRRYPQAAQRYAFAPALPHADDGDPRLITDAMGASFTAAHLLADTS